MRPVGYLVTVSKRHRTPRAVTRFGGREIWLPGYRSATANGAMLRNFERLCRTVEAGGDPDPSLLDWATQKLDPKRRERLIRYGVLSGAQAATGLTLETHIKAWQAHMAAKGVTLKYARERAQQVRDFAGRCGWTVASEIDPDRAMAEFGKMRDELSVRTAGKVLGAAKGFTRWLARFKGMKNKLDPLSVPKPRETEIKLTRHVLPPADVHKLLAWLDGPNAEAVRGIDTKERRLAYRLVLATGLRAAGVWSLTRGSFVLDGPTPVVRAVVKRGKVLEVPLIDAGLVADLRAHLADKLPATLAFRLGDYYRAANLIREDCARAGVECPVERVIDFHSLRTTFATTAAANGLPLDVLADVLGHDDPAVTRRYYVRAEVERRAQAMRDAARKSEGLIEGATVGNGGQRSTIKPA
jgi:integrase/recombinase XerD